MISKKALDDLVEVFYQSPYRSYYVNSDARGQFARPDGMFVSLGLTSSLQTLNRVRYSLESTGEYKTDIAEIVSTKDKHGNYLNQLIRLGDDDIFEQYEAVASEDEVLLSRESAIEEVNRLKGTLEELSEPEEERMVLRISSLEDLITRLDMTDGWERHFISKQENNYHLFHRFVNYYKSGEGEYRLGIYVTEKK